MNKVYSIIVAVAVVALAIGAGLTTYKRSHSVAAKLAKMGNEITRVNPVSPDVLPVHLWGVSKANLDGVHWAAICDIGSSRLAFLKQDPIDDSTSFGLDLPFAGDAPKQGGEWGENFSYSYADGEVKCRFFDAPFRISSEGTIHIGDETHHLKSRILIVVGLENKVIETRQFHRDPDA